MLVCLLSGLFVMPVLFTLFILAGLIARQFCMLQLVFEQGIRMDFPAMFEALDSSDHVGLNRLTPLDSLPFQAD